MATLSKANTTAQWYADDYPGVTMPRLDKFLLHSTETKSWPGYSGGASAPNATYDPRKREIRQHFPNLMSARALRNPSSTAVSENRDNVFQLEIIAYSDFKLGQSVAGLWIGDLTDTHMADIAQMIKELGVPPVSTVKWAEGQKTYVSGVRLSGPSYDAYKGILAHMHASGNDHWDVGGFRYSKLAKQLGAPTPTPEPPKKEEDDMFVCRYGSSAYRLVTGDRMVGISKSAYDAFVKVGAMNPALSNADVENLQSALTFEGE